MIVRASRPARLLIVFILLLGHGLTVGFGPPRLAAQDMDDAALWPAQVHGLVRMAPPRIDATAALMLEMATQTVLYQKDAGRRLPPASTTKMMTALLAIERGKLDDKVTVQASDLNVESLTGLQAGEVWRLEDLLYALLLSSDNAAAVAMARHIGGSEAGFVQMMNQQAALWGLKDTHFANPHGYDDPQHYSSAHDLAEIAKRGLANPVFAHIVATREHQVGWRDLTNLNELLGAYEGTKGVKTGTTDLAGQCLVSAVGRPGGQVLTVVLGSTDRYSDTRQLLDYYYATYSTVSLQLGPKGLNATRGPDGAEQVLVLPEERKALLPIWELPWLRVQRIAPGLASGSPTGPGGTARFLLARSLLAEMPLELSAP